MGFLPPSAVITLALACATLGACKGRSGHPDAGTTLPALPYLGSTPVDAVDVGKSGVTINKAEQVEPGLHLYCNEHNKWLGLFGMDGASLAKIELPGICVLAKPFREGFLVLHQNPQSEERSELLSYVSFNKVVMWTSTEIIHHDFDVVGDEIFAFGYQTEKEPIEGKLEDVQGMRVVVLDAANGKMKRAVHLSPVLRDLVSEERKQRPGDWYHCNSIDVLESDIAVAKAGQWLIACQKVNLAAVYDPAENKLSWKMKLDLDGPHNPTLLSADRMLIFDNGRMRGWSRIVEWDLAKQQALWSYGEAGSRFYSETRGAMQPLPNGNLLITESDRGRVFELTRNREVVWEFWAPETQTEQKTGQHMRLTVYRVTRLFADAISHPDYAALWARVYGEKKAP